MAVIEKLRSLLARILSVLVSGLSRLTDLTGRAADRVAPEESEPEPSRLEKVKAAAGRMTDRITPDGDDGGDDGGDGSRVKAAATHIADKVTPDGGGTGVKAAATHVADKVTPDDNGGVKATLQQAGRKARERVHAARAAEDDDGETAQDETAHNAEAQPDEPADAEAETDRGESTDAEAETDRGESTEAAAAPAPDEQVGPAAPRTDADLASERRRAAVKRLRQLSDEELAQLYAAEAQTRDREAVLDVLRQAMADRQS